MFSFLESFNEIKPKATMYFVDWRGIAYYFSPRKDIKHILKHINNQLVLLAQGNRQARSRHYTVMAFLGLSVLHMFYLQVGTFATDWEHLVAADPFYVLQLESLFAVIFGVMLMLGIFIYHTLEFNSPKHPIFNCLADIIIHDKRTFIFNSNKDFYKSGQFLVMNNYQSTLAITSIYLLYYDMMLLIKFSKYSFDTPAAYLGLVSGMAKMIVSTVAIGLLSKISFYASVLGYLMLDILLTRIKLAAGLLARKNIKEAFPNIMRLHIFIRRAAVTMRSVFELNALIGPVFISFLLVGCPINAIMFMWVLLQRDFKFIILAIVILVFAQLILIFGLHLYCAHFSNTLHGTFKMLLWYPPRLLRCPVRHRIRLADAIWRLHTKNKYGIKFLWLISIFSFTKFLIMYSRFLMFGYKYFK